MINREKDQIIFGVRAVIEALDAGKELEKVLLKSTQATSEIFKELSRRLREEMIPVQHVPMEKLNAVTKKNHQGVIAYVSEISYSEIEFILPKVFEEGKIPFILVLDQISDVRNFGAIARTAECAGVDAIVVPFKGGARITAEAVKTSAGALHTIPICRHPDLKGLLKYVTESGLQIYAASEKAGQTIYEADWNVPLCLVMGSEDLGVSSPLLKLTDELVSIPQFGTIGSLNVSVAAGVCMYEAIRQRGK